MRRPKSLSFTSVGSLIVIVFIMVLFFILYWVYTEKKQFQEESKRYEEQYRELKKEVMRSIVESTIDYIDFKKSQIEQRVKESIQARVYDAHGVATKIYEESRGRVPQKTIQHTIIEILRSTSNNNGRGYYFIYDMDGKNILYTSRPELEGSNMIDIQDEEGRYVIRDLISIIQSEKEGFSDYLWYKPSSGPGSDQKVSFVKLFEPYNWIIGTGEYYSNMDKIVREEIIQRREKIRFETNGYVWVMDTEPKMVLHPFKTRDNYQDWYHASGLKDYISADGKRIFIQMRDMCLKDSEGFIGYMWEKPNSESMHSKLSFVKLCPEMGWILGAGIYLDDMEQYLALKKLALKKSIKMRLITTLITLFSSVALMVMISYHFSKKVGTCLQHFTLFFKQAATEYEKIDTEKLEILELRSLANYANKMVDDRLIADMELKKSEEKFRTVADYAEDWEYWINPSGEYIHISPSCERITGYMTEEFIKSPDLLERITHPDDRAMIKRHFQDENNLRKSYDFDFRIITKSGKMVWINHKCRPIFDSTARFMGTRASNRNITERKDTEKALKDSEHKYRTLFNSASDGVFIHDFEGRIIELNKVVVEKLGYPKQSLLGMNMIDLDSRPSIQDFKELMARLKEKGQLIFERELISNTGTIIPVEFNCCLIEYHGELVALSMSRDVTERKEAEKALRRSEERLLQSQKMEAVGKLAGGISHDFNNILTTVIGYTELLLLKPKISEKDRPTLVEIKKSADRASSLTNQLLTFSRKQVSKESIINLNSLVKDMEKMLDRIIGEDVVLNTRLEENLGMIKADVTQIEQVIMNLSVNARDAMPNGGALTVETRNIYIDEYYTRNNPEVAPGFYISLIVIDTGHGMDERIKSQMFEPFFTSKEPGAGTGLGLSTVYGIVSQSKGHIEVVSDVGLGTTFKILFPRVLENPLPSKSLDPVLRSKGTGTLLIVEDEDEVREMMSSCLEQLGYKVYSAANGMEAIQIFKYNKNKIFDLMITDVVMPDMSGPDLSRQLIKRFPGLKVIYISGYTEKTIINYGILNEKTRFLQKPFSPNILHKNILMALQEPV